MVMVVRYGGEVMSWYRRVIAPLICKFRGHTAPEWKNFFAPWGGGLVTQSGQCKRCWLVIDERQILVPGENIPYWHGLSPVVEFKFTKWPWEN